MCTRTLNGIFLLPEELGKPMDAALTFSLQCFYDPICLSLIYPQTSTGRTPSPLVSSSRFVHNMTLQMLLDELMIEEQNNRYGFLFF